MKATVTTRDFARVLTIASRFVALRANLPILGSVVLKTDKNKLRVLATDLEISFSGSLGAKVEEEGEIAVPARAITEITNSLAAKNLDLELKEETLLLTGDAFKSSLLGVNTADYPTITTSTSERATKLLAKFFLPALTKVLFAVGSDESRPVLTGVLFLEENGNLALVGTDGFRLSQKKVNQTTLNEKTKQTIIPKRVLSEVVKLMTGNEIFFELKETEKEVIFSQGDFTLTSRLLEGNFPDFTRIIPKETKVTLNVSKEEFTRAIKVASVFARDNANIIKLEITQNGVAILAESGKAGTQESTLDAKVEGESVTMSVNFRYLEEFLSVVGSETVEMKFSNATTPGVFIDPKDSDFLHIIAPVRS